MRGQLPRIEHRSADDPEYRDIKDCVNMMSFVEYMKGKDIEELRLPVNNPEAYQYLRWLNNYFVDDNNYLNYLLNIWDEQYMVKKKPVRPPTAREVAIFNARRIVEIADSDEIDGKGVYIDSNAEFIRDAYQYWCYPIWIASGLAGCILKWGTFEDNVKECDEYLTWEEWNT
jgi:hypothetical protein